jgi:hypothetical protein
MQLTITVDENVIRQVAERAVAGTFFLGGRYEDSGAGAAAIKKQVKVWAESQDYTSAIAEVAPAIFRDVVRDTLSVAIRKIAQDELKRMKAAGEFGPLFQEV